MKQAFFSLVVALACHYAVVAQNSPPSDTIISGPGPSQTNSLAPATLSFTNQSGATYSVADLEGLLRNLQTAMDQTLPVLSAFNTNFGSTSVGGTAAEALGGVLSKVLSKNRSQNSGQDVTTNLSTPAGSSVTSNLVGVLRGILTTNNSNAVTVDPNTVAQVRTLQQHLEAASALLRQLNVNSFTGQTNSSNLTPTGR